MDDYRRRPPMEGFSRPGQLGRGGEAWNDEDSVEGHIMDDERTDQVDTEGHAITRKLDDEDTEGHGVFSRKASDDDEDDTEGHRINLK